MSTGEAAAPAASPQVLIVAPTRELCQQTADTARRIASNLIDAESQSNSTTSGCNESEDDSHHLNTKRPASLYTTGCVVGGVDYRGQRAHLLSARPRLLVATPGRLLSLCGGTPASTRARQQAAPRSGAEVASARAHSHQQAVDPPACRLDKIALLVLDEADRLLDMGFEEDLQEIRQLLPRQSDAHVADGACRLWTLLFSATWSSRTASLANTFLAPGAASLRVEPGQDASSVREGDCSGDAVSAVGDILAVASTVTQNVEILRGKGAPRLRRLVALLREVLDREAGDDESGDESDVDPEGDHGDGEEDGEDLAQDEIGEASLAALSLDDINYGSSVNADREAAEGMRVSDGPQDGPRVIVFCVYKKQAKDLARVLVDRGFDAVALQGDMSQTARSAAVKAFREGRAQVRKRKLGLLTAPARIPSHEMRVA